MSLLDELEDVAPPKDIPPEEVHAMALASIAVSFKRIADMLEKVGIQVNPAERTVN